MKRLFLLILRYMAAARKEKLHIKMYVEDYDYIFDITMDHDYRSNVPSFIDTFCRKLVENYVGEFTVYSEGDRVDLNCDIDLKKQSFSLDLEYFQTGEEYTENDGEFDDKKMSQYVDMYEFFKSRNLNELSVDYYGGGDSGDLESWTSNEGTLTSYEIPDTVSNVFWRILEDSYSGWEINEGSKGVITINLIDDDKIVYNINHTWFTEEYVESPSGTLEYTIDDLE